MLIVVVIFSLGRMLICSSHFLRTGQIQNVLMILKVKRCVWKLVGKVFFWTLTDTSLSSKLTKLVEK